MHIKLNKARLENLASIGQQHASRTYSSWDANSNKSWNSRWLHRCRVLRHERLRQRRWMRRERPNKLRAVRACECAPDDRRAPSLSSVSALENGATVTWTKHVRNYRPRVTRIHSTRMKWQGCYHAAALSRQNITKIKKRNYPLSIERNP